MRKPLRKKKIVTPKPPGITSSRPQCDRNTIKAATALIPSNDGIWNSLEVLADT
jgi:hypothetical protein